MTGLDFFMAEGNGPFLVAMAVALFIAIIEVVSTVLGLGLSDLIDDLLPDMDVDAGVDVDLDADLDVDTDVDIDGLDSEPGIAAQALGWLNVGRVPFLILLLLFLMLFAVGGYLVQSLAQSLFGFLLPSILLAPAMLVPVIPMLRLSTKAIGAMIPREETYAVGDESLVGRVATVSLGPITADNPGKAKVLDQHGNVHFVRVRAAKAGRQFDINARVLLVGHQGALFDAIEPPETLD